MTTTTLKWTRLSPGAYEATHGSHTFLIVHPQYDRWIVAHTGPAIQGNGEFGMDRDYPVEADATFKQAKATAESILEESLLT